MPWRLYNHGGAPAWHGFYRRRQGHLNFSGKRKLNLVFSGMRNFTIDGKQVHRGVAAVAINPRLPQVTTKTHLLATAAVDTCNVAFAHADASKLGSIGADAFSVVIAGKWTRDGNNTTTFYPNLS